MRPRAAAAIAGRLSEDDILRQVLIQRSEPIGDPRTDRRKCPLARMPAGVPGELSAVVVVIGPERADDSDIVGALADVPPPIRDHEPALPVTPVARVEAHEHVAIAVRRVAGDDVAALEFEHAAMRRVRNRLAGVAIQLRLDVEAFDVADAAAEEDPDDGLGARREVRPAVRWRIIRAGDAVLEEHGAQRQAGETHAGVGEKRAAADAAATDSLVMRHFSALVCSYGSQ